MDPTSPPWLFSPWAALGMALAGHALADGLQGRLSGLKRRALPGGGRKKASRWVPFLLLHGAAHGALCGLALWSWQAALCEWGAHCLIDWGKCEGRYGAMADQGMHVACKVVWVAFWVGGAWA